MQGGWGNMSVAETPRESTASTRPKRCQPKFCHDVCVWVCVSEDTVQAVLPRSFASCRFEIFVALRPEAAYARCSVNRAQKGLEKPPTRRPVVGDNGCKHSDPPPRLHINASRPARSTPPQRHGEKRLAAHLRSHLTPTGYPHPIDLHHAQPSYVTAVHATATRQCTRKRRGKRCVGHVVI